MCISKLFLLCALLFSFNSTSWWFSRNTKITYVAFPHMETIFFLFVKLLYIITALIQNSLLMVDVMAFHFLQKASEGFDIILMTFDNCCDLS